MKTPDFDNQTLPDSELLREFISEITRLENTGAGVPFVFSPSEAFMLLSLLQLALRHPGCVNGAVGEFGRRLAADIEGRVCICGPAMKEVARRGWLGRSSTHTQ